MKLSYEELESKFVETKSELIKTKSELAETKSEFIKVQAKFVRTQAELVKTQKELVEIKSLLKKALEEIVLLKEKLNKNSNNSSKPPSTDQKKNTEDKLSEKRNSRKGINRPLFSNEQIDKRIECSLNECPHCGCNSIKNLSKSDILQQIELPEVKAVITEYIIKKYYCNFCKNTFSAKLPKGIPNSSFGSRLMGLISNLTGVFHLAKREVIQIIKDLYDIDIGLGSISNIEERVSAALDPYYKKIHEFVLKSYLTKHFDETPWRDSGKRNYVWVITCEQAAIYMIDRYRNSLAFQKLLKNQNISDKNYVSDRYSLYNKIGSKHQYCLAHLIRNFRYFSQRDGPDKKIGESIAKLLAKSCSAHNKYCKKEITLAKRNQILRYAQKKVRYWLCDGIANGSDKLSSLCDRLYDDFDNLWVFKETKGVEPTNNLAERDLRKLVIWRKKSYGTRSNRGKRFVERITSISQTLRKQNKNVLRFIQQSIIYFYGGEKPAVSIDLEMNLFIA